MDHTLKNKTTKVCHLTSVHRSGDARIFYKECTSLSKKDYEVFLVAHGTGYTKNGVVVIGVGEQPTSRLKRMYLSTRSIYRAALKVDADIYHIHDPELLSYAYKLKKKGKTVIFDSHEDYLTAITEKTWIPSLLRKLVSALFTAYEKKVISAIDGAIVCYHWTEDRYKKCNKNVSMILNFPILSEEEIPLPMYGSRNICFAGLISSIWCHKEIVMALDQLKNVTYELAGTKDEKYGKQIKELAGWQYVNYHGVIPYETVKSEVYLKSAIGMALLDYIALCKGTIGNLSNTKFFEYMQMGLPLICTDFKLWREIIDEEHCGIFVNPHHVDEISNAITFLLDHPDQARIMGENGRKAVLNKYNWGTEEKKLYDLYRAIESEVRKI